MSCSRRDNENIPEHELTSSSIDIDNLNTSAGISQEHGTDLELSESPSPKRDFGHQHYCEICDLRCLSHLEFREHQWSTYHHTKLSQLGRKKESLHCDLCNARLSSLLNFNEHVNGWKHCKRLAKFRTTDNWRQMNDEKKRTRIHRRNFHDSERFGYHEGFEGQNHPSSYRGSSVSPGLATAQQECSQDRPNSRPRSVDRPRSRPQSADRPNSRSQSGERPSRQPPSHFPGGQHGGWERGENEEDTGGEEQQENGEEGISEEEEMDALDENIHPQQPMYPPQQPGGFCGPRPHHERFQGPGQWGWNTGQGGFHDNWRQPTPHNFHGNGWGWQPQGHFRPGFRPGMPPFGGMCPRFGWDMPPMGFPHHQPPPLMDMGLYPQQQQQQQHHPPWFNPMPDDPRRGDGNPHRAETKTADGEQDEARDKLSPKRKDTMNISMKASKIIDDILNRKRRPSINEHSPDNQSSDEARGHDGRSSQGLHKTQLLYRTKKLQDVQGKRLNVHRDCNQRARTVQASQEHSSASGIDRTKRGQIPSRLSQASGSRDLSQGGKRVVPEPPCNEVSSPNQKGIKGGNGKKGKFRKPDKQLQKESDVAEVASDTDPETVMPDKPKSHRLDQRLLKTLHSQLSQQTASSTAALSKDSLAKLVNSPRSRKDRFQVARLMRSHSRATQRLTSRPPLTLHPNSDTGSGEDTSDEAAYSLNLEELPADVKDQILQLINDEMTIAVGDSSDGDSGRLRLTSQSDDDVLIVEDLDSAVEEVDLLGHTADLPSHVELKDNQLVQLSLTSPESSETLQNFLDSAINTQTTSHIPADMLDTTIKAEICDLPDVKPEIPDSGQLTDVDSPGIGQLNMTSSLSEAVVKSESSDLPHTNTATMPKKGRKKKHKKAKVKITAAENVESRSLTVASNANKAPNGVTEGSDLSPSPQWEIEPPLGKSDAEPQIPVFSQAKEGAPEALKEKADAARTERGSIKRRHVSGADDEVIEVDAAEIKKSKHSRREPQDVSKPLGRSHPHNSSPSENHASAYVSKLEEVFEQSDLGLEIEASPPGMGVLSNQSATASWANSLFCSQTPEACVDQVLAISLEEEELRGKMNEANAAITRLEALLQKTQEQLERRVSQRQKLQRQEEELRVRRLRILRGAVADRHSGTQSRSSNADSPRRLSDVANLADIAPGTSEWDAGSTCTGISTASQKASTSEPVLIDLVDMKEEPISPPEEDEGMGAMIHAKPHEKGGSVNCEHGKKKEVSCAVSSEPDTTCQSESPQSLDSADCPKFVTEPVDDRNVDENPTVLGNSTSNKTQSVSHEDKFGKTSKEETNEPDLSTGSCKVASRSPSSSRLNPDDSLRPEALDMVRGPVSPRAACLEALVPRKKHLSANAVLAAVKSPEVNVEGTGDRPCESKVSSEVESTELLQKIQPDESSEAVKAELEPSSVDKPSSPTKTAVEDEIKPFGSRVTKPVGRARHSSAHGEMPKGLPSPSRTSLSGQTAQLTSGSVPQSAVPSKLLHTRTKSHSFSMGDTSQPGAEAQDGDPSGVKAKYVGSWSVGKVCSSDLLKKLALNFKGMKKGSYMVVSEEKWKEQSDSESEGKPQLTKYTQEASSSVQSQDLKRSLRERVEAKFTSPDGKGCKLSPEKTKALLDKFKFPESEYKASQEQSKSLRGMSHSRKTNFAGRNANNSSKNGSAHQASPVQCAGRGRGGRLPKSRGLDRQSVRQRLWKSRSDDHKLPKTTPAKSEQKNMGRGKMKKRVDKYLKDVTYSISKPKQELKKSLKAQRKSPRVKKSLLKKAEGGRTKDSVEQFMASPKRRVKPTGDVGKGNGSGKQPNKVSRPKRLGIKSNITVAQVMRSEDGSVASGSRSKPSLGGQRPRKLRTGPSPAPRGPKSRAEREPSPLVQQEAPGFSQDEEAEDVPIMSPGSPLPDIPFLLDAPSTSTVDDIAEASHQACLSSDSQEAAPAQVKSCSSGRKLSAQTSGADNETAVSSTTGPSLSDSLAVSQSAVAFFQDAIRKGRLNIGDSEAERISGQFEGHTAAIHCLVVWEEWMITGSEDHTLRRFHLKTGDCLTVYKAHTKGVQCLIVTSTGGHGAQIYSGSFDNSVACHDLVSGEFLTKTLFAHRVHCFHECWGCLYVGLGNGNVCCMDLKTHKLLDTFKCSDSPIRCIATAREGPRRLLCVASTDCSITIRDARTSLLIRTLEGHAKTPMTIRVRNHLLYSGAADWSVQVHNINTGEREHYLEHRGVVTSVGFKDKHLITGSYDGLIRVYNTESWELEQLYYGAGAGSVTAMEVDQNMLYSGNREGLVVGVRMDLTARFPCKYGTCSHVWGRQDHLEHHLLQDHLHANDDITKCMWARCCPEYLYPRTKFQAAKEHVLGHVRDDCGLAM